MREMSERTLKTVILVLAAVILLSGAWGMKLKRDRETRAFEALAESPLPEESMETAVCVEDAPIGIDICGAVAREGYYELPPDSRLKDAVLLAGGLTEEADRRRINLAMKLKDQQKIVIPAMGEVLEEESEGSLVNINTAGADRLESLPGVGPVYAERIMAYRKTNGPFASKEDLMNVSGIGEKTYANLEACICVE